MHADFDAEFAEYVELGIKQKRMKDGTWKVKSYKQWKEDGYRWNDDEELPRPRVRLWLTMVAPREEKANTTNSASSRHITSPPFVGRLFDETHVANYAAKAREDQERKNQLDINPSSSPPPSRADVEAYRCATMQSDDEEHQKQSGNVPATSIQPTLFVEQEATVRSRMT